MDSLSKEGEEPALVLISIVATLFFSLFDGGRPRIKYRIEYICNLFVDDLKKRRSAPRKRSRKTTKMDAKNKRIALI